jgi:diguanylate cyclase (GGDEF)-like protein
MNAGTLASRRVENLKANVSPAENMAARRPRAQLPIFAVALIGVLLSLLASVLVWRWEQRVAWQEFAAIAENRSVIVQERLNEYLSKVVALRAFIDASDDIVTRNEFESFARPLLQLNSAIQTLSWIPRISRQERFEHEHAAVRDALADYHIKDMTTDRTMVVAAEQDEYLPIFYSTVPRTSQLYGLNLRSEPLVLAELEIARDHDQLRFFEISALVSVAGKQHGFIFSLPVYRKGTNTLTVAERRRNLAGYVHGSFITAKMIENILSGANTPPGVTLHFFRPRSDPDELSLYSYASPLNAAPVKPMSKAQLQAPSLWSRDLIAGNEPWVTLVAVPTAEGLLKAPHERTLGVLMASLFLTLLLVLYLRTSLNHARRLMRANEEISTLALKDSLTGLYNRRAFNDFLSKALESDGLVSCQLAVLYFDLDHFKDVNDTLGHPVGDRLLRLVAERIQSTVRRDDIVARFGGDEFAILQSSADESLAMQLAARINQLLAQPFVIDGNDVHITASIGIALCNNRSATPDVLIMQADLALYRAKEDGRNCFRFHRWDFDIEVHERVAIADDLRGAAERGELRLYYQSQVDLGTGRIVGVEGLLRWLHPKRGLLEPSKFIPAAERTGAINALGEWTLAEACRQARAWSDLGIVPEIVAVNVSASQFRVGSEFEDFLAATLHKWNVAPSSIEIELTESVLMEVSEQHSQNLERLRRLGVKIAIDDFGTGYSSLNYLTGYPVNRLKIAQELVFGIIKDRRNATVVRAAIRLADELGIECIAEGIETEEQVKFLVAAGCNRGQGYYFSKPLAADQMTILLAQDRKGHRRAVPRLELVAG